MRSTRMVIVWLGAVLCSWAASAEAVRLAVDSATVAASGDTASLCVSLDSEGLEVAGTQNRIYWNPSCITPLDEECRTSPTHSKTAYTLLHDEADPPWIATLVISLQESGPIPDGELYCCNFVAHLDAPGDCCGVQLTDAISASPDAERLTTDIGDSGTICLDPDATPRPPIIPDTRTPTWTPSPAPWDPTATPTATTVPTEAAPTTTPLQSGNAQAVPGDENDDSCQVTRGDDASGLAALLLLPAVLVWRRRRAS